MRAAGKLRANKRSALSVSKSREDNTSAKKHSRKEKV